MRFYHGMIALLLFACTLSCQDPALAPKEIPEAPRAAVPTKREPQPGEAGSPKDNVLVGPLSAEQKKGRLIGEFKATAYCPCGVCCGKWANYPLDQRQWFVQQPNAPVVAVDPKVLTLGKWYWINGVGARKAEDVGGAIKGHHIDVLFNRNPEDFAESHSEARMFGVRLLEVWEYPNPEL